MHEKNIEELKKYMSGLNTAYMNDRAELEKVEKILNAKLLEQTNNRLEGLSSEINQLYQSLRDGIKSNSKLTIAMVCFTAILAGATIGLVVTGIVQKNLLNQYTKETRNLGKIASEQLIQSQLDSNIINRPYVEIRPIGQIMRSGKRDPKDSGSEFCTLRIAIKNYSKTIPATNVTLEDFKIDIIGDRPLTPKNSPISLEDISLFPESEYVLIFRFVMSASIMEECDKGEKDCHIYLKINYRGIKNTEDKLPHWYTCNWKYNRYEFSIVDSNTDLITYKQSQPD